MPPTRASFVQAPSFTAYRSLKRSDAFQVAEIHPDEEGLADDVLVRHEAPETRIHRVVAVVAHHEVVTLRHLAGDTLGTVAAVLAIWKGLVHGQIQLAAAVAEDAGVDNAQLFLQRLLEVQR